MDVFLQNLIIKNMTMETVKAVAEIERICFASPWSFKSLFSELSNPLAVFLTADIGGAIIGYAGMHHIIDEGYVTNIAVLPDYRRRGVARALTEELIIYGKQNGLRMITLEVRESNTSARNLYESLKFKIVGGRRDFYSRPDEDAVLMTCELQA